jgi:hypothetical protein
MLWMRAGRRLRRATPFAAAALACGVIVALSLLGARVEAPSLFVAGLTAAMLAVNGARWGARTTATGMIAVGLLLIAPQAYADVAGDVWFGCVVGAGVAAALYGVEIARGRGRWQAGLLAQLALIAIGMQLAYRDRGPVALLSAPGSDKVLHATLIGAAAFWFNLVLEGRRWRGAPVAVLVPLTLALVEEIVQGLVPWRSLDALDLAADLIGLVVFWLISERVRRGGGPILQGE